MRNMKTSLLAAAVLAASVQAWSAPPQMMAVTGVDKPSRKSSKSTHKQNKRKKGK